jgi:hypothetical protein
MAVLPPPPPPPPAAPPPPYPGMYGAPPPYGAPLTRPRTSMILAAQILMVVKGVFWLIAGSGVAVLGLYLVVHGADVHRAPGSPDSLGLDSLAKGLVGVAAAFAVMAGLVLIAGGVADILLGVTVGRPSSVARWFTVVLNTVTGVIALVGIVGEANNHRGITVGLVFPAVWLAVNIVIFYALVIDERSRQAFR